MKLERIETLPSPPVRNDDAHKGTCGRAMIISGSWGMSGAAVLAGCSALRAGAGLVFLAIPESILPMVSSAEPSYITLPLPVGEDQQLSSEAGALVFDHVRSKDAVAIGPGLGQSETVHELVHQVYAECEHPLVVDADALNAFENETALLSTKPSPRILTPHPGEFSRLLNIEIAQIQTNREQHTTTFAKEHQVILVLKGPNTIITDGTRIAMNTTGNAGMATGGTGDVLTGIITALLAQGMEPFSAAQLAVHLHGLAGDLAAAELSQPGMIASDLPRFLPRAWKQMP